MAKPTQEQLKNQGSPPPVPTGIEGTAWAWNGTQWVRSYAAAGNRPPSAPTPGAVVGGGTQAGRGTAAPPTTTPPAAGGATNLRDQNTPPTLDPGTGYAWAWNPTLNGGQWVRSSAEFRRQQQQAGGGAASDDPNKPIGGNRTGAGNEPMSEQSARAIIRGFLQQFDLGGLEDLLYNELVSEQDFSEVRLMQRIRETPDYQRRFPGMSGRQSQGRNAITEAEYIAMERGYKQLFQQAGLPQGFYDEPTDFGGFIAGDISVAEMGRRVQQGYQAVSQADPSVKESLRAFYGVTDGELAAFFLDPGKAESLIMQQTATAQIGAAAAREGFGAAADRLAAERMQRLGVTEQEATQAFGVLGRSQELLTPIERGETALDVAETALGLTGRGGSEAAQRFRTQQRRRVAAFEGGGRFATQGGDVVGLQQA
jgi:hypothetical protein